ncbi:alpha/beta hydrolase family protein [Pseudomonas sp. RIT-PI-S]|uniref:alpha/beta hydrolase family protein n=1 Tax=Pseudomonas sp. RIT-PI-S TaxID=3035295 RepID=UPI0021D7D576|nr:alpha/beta hydrolase family protein [Pseudomonas sp. RIT-PI-S]
MRALPHATLLALATALPLSLALTATAADAPAEPPAAAVERPPLLERSEQEAQALARQLPAQEQQTLQAGGDNFLALWHPANDPDPAGMVIIIPGAGETANWPEVVAPLRNRLPDARWSTLSLTLPDLLSEAMQPRAVDPPAPAAAGSSATPADANAPIEQAAASGADATAPAPAETPDDQLKTDAARIFARIDAGIAFAQQVKARNIVLVGHGTGAYWAARYLSERQPSRAQRLVMVAGKTPDAAPAGLDQLAPQLKVPVADIYYATSPALRSAAAQRLQASKRQVGSLYSQTELAPLPGDRTAEQEQLYRRVRGWLSPQS